MLMDDPEMKALVAAFAADAEIAASGVLDAGD